MEARLKEVVDEQYWNRVEAYVQHFLQERQQARVQQQQQAARPSQVSASIGILRQEIPNRRRLALNNNNAVPTFVNQEAMPAATAEYAAPPATAAPIRSVVTATTGSLPSSKGTEETCLRSRSQNNNEEQQQQVCPRIEEEMDECAICLESMPRGPSVGVVRHCGHRYHKDCFCDWKAAQKRTGKPPTCPLCKGIADSFDICLPTGAVDVIQDYMQNPSDLRLLTMEQLAGILRSHGMTQNEIDTLKRWDRVFMILKVFMKDRSSDGSL